MPFIRAGHTEVGDGTCGLCDLVWPCDAGTVLMALAAATQRAEQVEQRAAALESALTEIKIGIEQSEVKAREPNNYTKFRSHGVLAQVYMVAASALAASGGAAPAERAGGA
jgi:hypothetical protein